jgi:hypothetical protein
MKRSWFPRRESGPLEEKLAPLEEKLDPLKRSLLAPLKRSWTP